MSRCVRQDYLLSGDSAKTEFGSYRNDWIERRLLHLADVFAIDVYAFAIMDNHTHTVLHANLPLANQWSDTEVLLRWSKIGTLPLLCQIYLSNDWRQNLNEVELCVIKEKITEIRHKLTDISCFMRYFNYYIARRANKEDGVKGHFWEARFKSQALLDADAFLACMAYVDLNPIRAGKSTSLETSRNTSINRRVNASQNKKRTLLSPFRSQYIQSAVPTLIDLTLEKYIAYVQTTLMSGNNFSSIKLTENDTESCDIWLFSKGQLEESNWIGTGMIGNTPEIQSYLYGPANAQNKEQRALADAILVRLLDDQYPSCSADHAN